MSQLSMIPASTDEASADAMVKESRIALALLDRFTHEMSHTTEGRVYINLIHDACCGAVDWATSHCSWDVA